MKENFCHLAICFPYVLDNFCLSIPPLMLSFLLNRYFLGAILIPLSFLLLYIYFKGIFLVVLVGITTTLSNYNNLI